jgi:hypothetical protein
LKAYQSTNSGDTYIDASNSTGVVRVNYETGAGTSFNIYGGSSSTLYASFTGTTSIKFPGLAATTGHGCLQVDTSGFMTNSGVGCGLAAVGSAGLTFYDGTIQTTTEQGALTGSADDSTARTSAAAAQTTATAALPANGLTSSTGGNLTASGTVTANTVSVPNAHRAYGNRSDILDAVADCGEVGDGVTNNSTARASCLSAHPLMTEFFPPRYWNGTADVQAVYYASATTNLPTQSGLASTGGDYGCPRGAILSYPAGVTGITMQQASQVHDLCVEGSEPASVTGTDGYNAIFPSGASLLEYQEVVTSINVTSNVLTINFAAGTRTWWLAGGEVQVVLPSPYTSLNGYYYLTSVVESTGSGANITVAAPGAAAVATTTISGTCPGAGCVLPATTGTSNSDGIDAEGAFAKLDHVYVSKFGHNGVEIDGSDYISDDPSLKNVTTYGNRGHGLYVHGGDANQGYYDDYVGYFNGIYCAFDVAFLSSTYVNPQCSYNDGYGAAAAGTAETISSIARTVASNVNTVAVVTSTAMPHIAVGNAICVSGVTDTSFNTCTAATASGFVTAVTSSTQFTYIQPGYGLSNSTSSGGTIQLPTRTQLYTLAAFDGGSYTVGRNNNAGNYVMINPYNEGDGAVVQPGACANRFNLGVVIVNGHMGNCTDPNWLGSAESANGLNGMTFPPHTDEAQVTPVVSNESGGGQDTNSLQNYKDLSMTPAGLSGQVDLRLTAPGQTTSWLGLRTNTNADQAGMYNYAALFGYGASASAGATTTIGSSTFIGSGTNDMTVSGTSTLASTASYSVEVCATGTPDSFCWAVGAGSYSAPVAITGAAQSLQNGLTATFASTTGHALNNSWGFTVTFAAGARPQLWVPNALRLGNSSYSVTRKFAECAATPTSTQSPDGQWFAGDWCYNDMATTNTILAWVCTVSSGTPSACSNWYAVPNTGAVVTAVNVVTNGGITNTGTTTAPNLECTAATTTQAGCATLSLSSPTPTPIDGYCEGTIGTAVSGSYMLAPFALRNAATPSCSANGTNSTVNSFVTPGSCTARNLYVRSTTAGASASACSVKFYHNGAATALSCLLGTGTSCNDTTDTVSIAAGDTYGIEVVTSTAGSDACGGITAALQCY